MTGTHTWTQRNILARQTVIVHGEGMIIAVVNQKGGVGKTTLAVHLAVWLHERGKRVAFIDADGQSSSTRWIRTAEPSVALHTETGADAIIEKANDLRSRFDTVVADGPANLAEGTRALLLVADYALVPCGVTVPELESTADTLRILRNAHQIRPPGLPHACIVLSRLRNDRYLLTREAGDAARMLGVPVCEQVVRLRESIADAPGQRTVVWRMGRRAGVAATELRKVLAEVTDYGQR